MAHVPTQAQALTPAPQYPVVLGSLAIITALGVLIQQTVSTRMALLLAVGSALGIVLYHSLFGFTSTFRVLLADRRSAGFRAQMIMLGTACLLFFPVLASGTFFDQTVNGFVSPLSVSAAFGAFLFGIGMQLGGGCASGTLFAVGGGNTRMLMTLLFFIVGSVIGVTHLAWWQTLPSHAPVSLVKTLGWPAALALNVVLFSIAYAVVARMEHARHGALENIVTIKMHSGCAARGLCWREHWHLRCSISRHWILRVVPGASRRHSACGVAWRCRALVCRSGPGQVIKMLQRKRRFRPACSPTSHR